MNVPERRVVVIGAGIGGVIAAALLARQGRQVVLVEQGPGAGGYVHAFTRGPYTIDPAVHSLVDQGLYEGLLAYLGVRDRCELIPLDDAHHVLGPGVDFRAPLGLEAYVEAHVAACPAEADAVRAFLGICEQVHREGHELPMRLPLRELDEHAARYPTLFRYRKATLADVLDETISDPRARYACSVSSIVLGLPPSRLSFSTFAQAVFSAVTAGEFIVQGGLQKLVDALVAGLEASGGVLRTGKRATRIGVRDGGVTGVELDDGEWLPAGAVVSNADVTRTFGELLDPDAVPADVARRLERLTCAVSAFELFVAIEQDLGRSGLAHLTFVSNSLDLETAYGRQMVGRASSLGLYLPTIVDGTLAPEGHSVLTGVFTTSRHPGQPWRDLKAAALEDAMVLVDRAIPGFRDGLVFAEAATPETLERYTGNRDGSIYGWENTPASTANRRPPQKTPIRGLYLAGHWTQPGAGFLRALCSGIYAAELIAQDDPDGGLAAFHPPQIPPLSSIGQG